MTRHRPYHPMNPRSGISPAHRTVPAYCYASSDGEDGKRGGILSYLALAPIGAGDVGSRPTANYSLLTANWSYTFSAKERDPETGLSYFGSRYYSSDLSIWLSVDPMSDKYASLSPYVYCADNPVMLVDPNGEDPIYAKNFWGKVKKIGDDGQCGSGSYLVRGKTARAVKAATKAGEFYTGDLSASDEVIHIPTGQILQNVQFTVEQSLNSGTSPDDRVEYGGHALENDVSAHIWDPGTITETSDLSSGATLKRRSLTPFMIDGKKYQLGDPVRKVIFMWHVHTYESTPSGKDFKWMKDWRNKVAGCAFIVCPNDGKVSFYNETKTVIRISYEEFKLMGRQEDLK